MRAYLGAAIYNSANVIRIPHVLIETIDKVTEAKNITQDVAMNVMVVGETRAKQIAGLIGKEATFIHGATAGKFVDPSTSASGGTASAAADGGAATAGEVSRKKKSSKSQA